MIYFIYGNQSPTIRSLIKKIAKESLGSSLDDLSFVKMDGFNSLVQDAVSECQYLPLGADKKVVSLENCYFLQKEKVKNKLDPDQDFEVLIKYLESPNPECDLLVSVNTSDIDTKSKIVSLLKEKGKEMPILDPNEMDWKTFVKQCFEKAETTIDKDALDEVANRTATDVSLLYNTVSKLSLYKKHISYNDVKLMVTRPLEENAFMLFTYLTQNRIGDAVGLFRDLKETNTEPVTIISMLASQFRLLNQIAYLVKKGIDKEEIAKQLGIKPGRVYILSKLIRTINEKKIQDTLESLYKLDLDIKSGQVDRFYAFEIFLLNFKTN